MDVDWAALASQSWHEVGTDLSDYRQCCEKQLDLMRWAWPVVAYLVMGVCWVKVRHKEKDTQASTCQDDRCVECEVEGVEERDSRTPASLRAWAKPDGWVVEYP